MGAGQRTANVNIVADIGGTRDGVKAVVGQLVAGLVPFNESRLPHFRWRSTIRE